MPLRHQSPLDWEPFGSTLPEHHLPSETPVTLPVRARTDNRENEQRVVITGIGLVSPFGVGIDPFWTGLIRGRTALHPIHGFSTEGFPWQFGGEVHDFFPARDPILAQASRAAHYAVAAARLALTNANVVIGDDNREEIGLILGYQPPPAQPIEQPVPDMPAALTAICIGARGYNGQLSSPDVASLQAIGEATTQIRRGTMTMMLAGGVEALSRERLQWLGSMGLLTQRNEPGAAAPFDAQRDGFVPSEGGVILLLERLSHARERGAHIYAEITGYGVSNDAYHPTEPHPEGRGAVRAMERALQDARLEAEKIDYIGANASGLPKADLMETIAIRRLFRAHARTLAVSSIKGTIGHMGAASGAATVAATALALKFGLLPPTLHLDHADPACDLDYVAQAARDSEAQYALANAFGIGGVNAVLALRRSSAMQQNTEPFWQAS